MISRPASVSVIGVVLVLAAAACGSGRMGFGDDGAPVPGGDGADPYNGGGPSLGDTDGGV